MWTVIKIENFTFHCGPHYLCEKHWFRGRFILLVAQQCNKVNFKLDLAHHCTPQYSENAENVWFLCLLFAIVMGPQPAVNVGSFVNCKMQPLLYIFIQFLSQSVGGDFTLAGNWETFLIPFPLQAPMKEDPFAQRCGGKNTRLDYITNFLRTQSLEHFLYNC